MFVMGNEAEKIILKRNASVYEVSRRESQGQGANRMPPNAYHQDVGAPGHGAEKGKEDT